MILYELPQQKHFDGQLHGLLVLERAHKPSNLSFIELQNLEV